MRWNCFAGTAIVPTLARLVLALAFITSGYNKIFRSAEFNADQAETLRELGVELTPEATTVAFIRPLIAIVQDEAEPENQDAPIEGPADEGDQDAAEEAAEDAIAEQDGGDQGEVIEIPEVESAATYRGQSINHLVLLLDSNEVPRPRLMAWIVALTEFGGGILVLIGLFSRVWGLGLAITMGMAFYLTSMHQYFGEVGPFDAATAEHRDLSSTVFTQLSLGLLALLIFLAGPGPLSLDRLIFRPRKRDETFEDVEPRHDR